MSIAPWTELPLVDTADPAFSFEGAMGREAREANWCVRTPRGLAALRYVEVRDLLRDGRLAQNGAAFLAMHSVHDGPLHEFFTASVLNLAGHEHARIRALANRAFVPSAVERVRPALRETIGRIADEVAEAGDCDFVSEFATRVPAQTVQHILGVGADEEARILHLAGGIGELFNIGEGPHVLARVNRAVEQMKQFASELVADRRRHPTEDLISRLVALSVDQHRSTEEQLTNLVMTLLAGAMDTSRLQLGRAMVTFAEHPAQWSALAHRPDLAAQAVDEVARWSPIIQAISRFAGEDFSYRGVAFPARGFVQLGVASANRDPRVFDDPDTFDITVHRTVSNLTFSEGPHFCLGSIFARAAMAESLVALATRVECPRIVGDVVWSSPRGHYGPRVLPLRFRPRRVSR
jgi:cytochrome P450